MTNSLSLNPVTLPLNVPQYAYPMSIGLWILALSITLWLIVVLSDRAIFICIVALINLARIVLLIHILEPKETVYFYAIRRLSLANNRLRSLYLLNITVKLLLWIVMQVIDNRCLNTSCFAVVLVSSRCCACFLVWIILRWVKIIFIQVA